MAVNRSHFAAAVRTALLIASIASAPFAFGDSHGSLAGRWKLNEDLSDHPREASRDGRSEGRRRGGFVPGRGRPGVGGTGPGSVMGPGGGFGGRGRFRDGTDSDRSAMLASEVEIRVTDLEVVVKSKDRPDRHFFTDGRKVSVEMPRGTGERVSTWDGDRLRVTTVFEEGRRIVDEFQVNPETGRLIMTTTIRRSASGESVTYRRVYDRFD